MPSDHDGPGRGIYFFSKEKVMVKPKTEQPREQLTAEVALALIVFDELWQALQGVPECLQQRHRCWD